MLIFLTRFVHAGGTAWLPQFDPVDPLDTAGYKSNTLPMSQGGTYDPDAGHRLPRHQRSLSRRGTLIETSEADVQAAYDALAIASGTDGLLFGRNETGDLALHIPARLLVDPGTREPGKIYRYRGHWTIDVTTVFEVGAPYWRGTRHGTALGPLDTGIGLDAGVPLDDVADTYTLDISPKNLVITNGGITTVDDAVLSLLVAGTDITALTIQSGRSNWTVSGTIKVGNTLVVDTAGEVLHQSALTAGVAAGVASLPVANPSGLGWAPGGRIRIILDDETTYEGDIDHITGSTVVLTAGLPYSAATGRTVAAAAYSGFSRDAVLHSTESWLELKPGANTVVVTRTGGANSQLTFSFWDAYL